MSALHFPILTTQEIPMDLSRPAIMYVLACMGYCPRTGPLSPEVACEVDNFRNLLLNLLERSEPETGNLDLIGG